MVFRRLPLLASFLLALGAGNLVIVADDDLSTVLADFDAAQDAVQRLSADFAETTYNSLLKEPIIAKGRFYMTKPDSIRWEYEQPEKMRFVISSDEYTGYFPVRKRAERRNIRRWSERIFRFIGLGQGSDELKKFYNISLAAAEEQAEGTIHLILEPKKKRVRKRIAQVDFWLDENSKLPIRVEYSGQNGNRRVIVFSNIALNPDLATSLYTVEIPADVEVTNGFNGMPGWSVDEE